MFRTCRTPKDESTQKTFQSTPSDIKEKCIRCIQILILGQTIKIPYFIGFILIITKSEKRLWVIGEYRWRSNTQPNMFGIWLVTVIFVIFYVYIKNRKLYVAGEKFPGPRALPILGNSLDFATNSYGIFLKVTEFCKKYERFFRIWNNGRLYVFCYDHKDAEALLSSNKELKKTDLYKFLKPWIGNGLVSTSDIDLWRMHRKIITPTFHFKILHDFLDVFNRNARILSDHLGAQVGKGPFNVCNAIKMAALDNICETAMGVKVNAQENSESEYVKAVQKISQIVSLRCFKVWLMLDFIFNLSNFAKIQKHCLEVLHGNTRKVIHERREKLTELKRKENEDPDEGFSETRKLAFLDLLLKSEEGSRLSDRELREEVDTFMFAGHDTISSAMCFGICCLADNPDAQEAAYKEQLAIFGDSDRSPTFAEVQEMKYLERTLKEVLRLYPSAPIIGRNLSEDFTLPGGYKVPKGSQIIVNIHALHRNPKVWAEPEKFSPDNFLPEAVQSRNPYAYIPFSAGPRNCMGQKYSMLALKATFSLLLRKFKFLPSPNPEHKLKPAFEIVLLSVNGYHIQVESRN